MRDGEPIHFCIDGWKHLDTGCDCPCSLCRKRDAPDICQCGRPDHHKLIRQLREALGMSAGATPPTPDQAWHEAIAVARRLAGTRPIDMHDDQVPTEGAPGSKLGEP